MGRAIGERLAAKGVDLAVYNRTTTVAREFSQEQGSRWVGSPREVGELADTVIISVSDDRALDQVCTGPAGLLSGVRPGVLLIDTSTTGTGVADELVSRLTELRANLLECPISGTPNRALQGALLLLAGGDSEDFKRALPLLRLLGEPLHVGKLGAGTALKLAVNVVLFSLNQATGEALLLAQAGGVDARRFLSVLRSSPAGAALHGLLEEQYIHPDTSVGAGTFATADKDLALASRAAIRGQLELPHLEKLREIIGALVNDGHGPAEIGTIPALMRARPKGSTVGPYTSVAPSLDRD